MLHSILYSLFVFPGSDCQTYMYKTGYFTVGGDWEGLSKFIGTSGPNGKFFCNHCLVTLDHVKKGVPHAQHILPKYQTYMGDDGSDYPYKDCNYPLRTFDRCKEMNAKYREAGEKAKSLNYESCEYAPLLEGEHIIDTVSTTPLHVSLGLGQHILTVLEDTAISQDKEIKEHQGHYDAFTTLYDLKNEVIKSCQSVQKEIEVVEEKISQVIEKKKEIVKERAQFFNKKHSSYKSDIAKGVRDRFAKLGKEKDGLEKDKEKLEKALKKKETKLENAIKELEKIRGPFKERLDKLLDSLRLKRAAYHSGALIGPDVKKLVTKGNISKFGEVFRPIELKVYSKDGALEESHVLGLNATRVKIVTLLTKFRLCYELYTANRSLCRHEVEMLALRCVSFGNWFPVNFPHENLKRKFHLLTVDVPKQARRMKTIGMITEQTIESIHPYINELDRRFAKVADKTQKGLIICKQQNMYSQTSWNAVKKRVVSKKQKSC